MEKTLVLVKPDGVQRGLVGKIISRLENKGFRLAALKLMNVSRKLAEEHYGEHVDKPFFGNLVRFITSSPIVAMAIEGENAVQVVRTTMGLTNPQEASPGTIRGDFALTIGMNLIHGSDSGESAVRELDLFFGPSEILEYSRDVERWIIE
ncbi:MAG: nucleoside-diphosphate kinase [Chloroflexi bacterium]|nr:nucleoside-diphosphate kinase [Chloroflexota bacterium]MCL0055509.1 nucleoside-diphosphate kinase [Dehalococcoidia bacterium]MQG02928.1 nucleoside-diphosphate kinase [SAR202 cluster bacterium]HAE32535.1 nucleoside-diphosphate kinase [Dehalococcoidia bacterium]